MQLNLKLHIGKLVNKATMQYEQMVLFQGMSLHTQMHDYCDRVYGKGNWTVTRLTETQYHLEIEDDMIEGEPYGHWLKSPSYERDRAATLANRFVETNEFPF